MPFHRKLSPPKTASRKSSSRFFRNLVSPPFPSPTTSKNLHELLPGDDYCPFNSLIRIFTGEGKCLQSLLLFQKLLSGLLLKPNLSAIPSIFRSSARLQLMDAGLAVHGYLLKLGLMNWVGAGVSLMKMYVKFGRLRDAYEAFDDIPVRNSDLYNSLLCGFGSSGFYEEVVVVFERMLELCLPPSFDAVLHTIRACGELGNVEKGQLVHDFVEKNEFSINVFVGNALVSMYIKMGRLDSGRYVFDCMKDRDVASWNSLITRYAQTENWGEAFNIFFRMQKDGNCTPNYITLLGLLSACGHAETLDLGKSIHGHSIQLGMFNDFHVGTAVVDMYAKCGCIDCAQTIFEVELLQKSLVTWNSLILGYSKAGHDNEAIVLYERMILESNLRPDSVTLAIVVPAYASSSNIRKIQSTHGVIIKKGFDMNKDVVLGTAMLDAYGRCSDVKAAETLFVNIAQPNVITWNAMIGSHNLGLQAEQGLSLFLMMLQRQFLPDAVTMLTMLQSCGQLGFLKQGKMGHGYCMLKGFSSHLIVANALIDTYVKCGCIESADLLFSLMSNKNIVTWNTMLFGYVKIGSPAMAVELFREMQIENVFQPDSVTIISFMQAITAVFAGRGGEIAHSYVLKLGLDSQTLVLNCLIDAYAKDGLIEKASTLFMQMGILRDQSSWNVMISGCGMNSQGQKACDLFSQMEEDGFQPDLITFASLLSSCSHSGMIEEGSRYFDMMVTKYRIQPGLEHWTCIVDMFGRAGKLAEACQLIKHSQSENQNGYGYMGSDAIWGALLSASNTNLNVELGELAAKKLSTLEPDNCGYHILLTNLHASRENWSEAARVRKVCDGRLCKELGFSMVTA